MSPRHFHAAQNDPRYYSHHYKDESAEGQLEAKVESFVVKVWAWIKRKK